MQTCLADPLATSLDEALVLQRDEVSEVDDYWMGLMDELLAPSECSTPTPERPMNFKSLRAILRKALAKVHSANSRPQKGASAFVRPPKGKRFKALDRQSFHLGHFLRHGQSCAGKSWPAFVEAGLLEATRGWPEPRAEVACLIRTRLLAGADHARFNRNHISDRQAEQWRREDLRNEFALRIAGLEFGDAVETATILRTVGADWPNAFDSEGAAVRAIHKALRGRGYVQKRPRNASGKESPTWYRQGVVAPKVGRPRKVRDVEFVRKAA